MAKKAKAVKKEQARIARELATMGRLISESLDAAAHSPEIKAIRSELLRSVKGLREKLAKAVAAAGSSPRARSLGKQVRRVVDAGKKQGAVAVEKVRCGVGCGMAEVDSRIKKIARKLKK
jgi:hypothetical protein